MFIKEFLTNGTILQVFLIVITVYFTEFSVNEFKNRREKKRLVQSSLSNIKMLGYRLNKAAYHRYEAEVYSNHYDVIGGEDMVRQANLNLIESLRSLSEKMYNLYSEIFFHLDVIQKNLGFKKWKKVEAAANAILNYKILTIGHPRDLGIQVVDLEDYKKECIDKIKIALVEEIDKKIEKFLSETQNVA